MREGGREGGREGRRERERERETDTCRHIIIVSKCTHIELKGSQSSSAVVEVGIKRLPLVGRSLVCPLKHLQHTCNE